MLNVRSIQKTIKWKLGANLQPYVFWYFFILDKSTDELKVCVASSRVGNFDFFQATFHQLPEKSRFLFNGHRVCKSLIAVAKICGKPYRCLGESLGRPLAILE